MILFRQKSIFRIEFCFVLQKLSRICSKPYQKKIFEEKHSEVSCLKILEFNNTKKICNNFDQTNNSIIQENPQLANFLFEYAKDNLAVLYLYIKDPYFTLIKKDERMSTLSLIANAGGLLGLCMGMSFVSIFEVFYHCLQYCLQKISLTVHPKQ